MYRTAIVAVALTCLSAHAATPAPLEKPAGARDAKDTHQRVIGWAIGPATNPLQVIRLGSGEGGSASPLKMDREYNPRSIATLRQWKQLRSDIRKRVLGYVGAMPSDKLPLDVKVESEKDNGDYVLRTVSVAFDKKIRGKIALVIPKGLPARAPAVIIYDGWGGGIQRLTEGVYSRAFAVHLARDGFVVAALDHWYKQFGESTELATLGAAVHMATRTRQYLAAQKKLVAGDQIGVFGHTYGGELALFVAAMDEQIAACACSCSKNAVLPREYHYPPWTGRSGGLGCVARFRPSMFPSRRPWGSQGKYPFLTQEFMALMAPRPYLGILNDKKLSECIRPAWKLYGAERHVEMISHRWGENLPVNVRDYLTDFYLRSMRGMKPGKCPEPTAKKILSALRGEDKAKRLEAVRLAAWWRLKPATGELVKLIKSKDAPLRRAAAQALLRAGAMKQLTPYITDPDPTVRITVVEAMQLHGDEAAFEALAEHQDDKDRWAREAKFQTMQIHPDE